MTLSHPNHFPKAPTSKHHSQIKFLLSYYLTMRMKLQHEELFGGGGGRTIFKP
jgi:hypothetical protein